MPGGGGGRASPRVGMSSQRIVYRSRRRRSLKEREPEPPSVHRSGLDRGLEAICMRCLRSDPRRRFADGRELSLEDLEDKADLPDGAWLVLDRLNPAKVGLERSSLRKQGYRSLATASWQA